MNILVVEDKYECALTAKEALSSKGNVINSYDLEDALNVIKHNQPQPICVLKNYAAITYSTSFIISGAKKGLIDCCVNNSTFLPNKSSKKKAKLIKLS